MYARTVGTKIAKTEYTEEWADPRKRSKILGKPRRYILTFYLYNTSGEHMVATIDPPKNKRHKYSMDDLSNLVYEHINKLMDENPYQDFDLVSTYINIRA